MGVKDLNCFGINIIQTEPPTTTTPIYSTSYHQFNSPDSQAFYTIDYFVALHPVAQHCNLFVFIELHGMPLMELMIGDLKI